MSKIEDAVGAEDALGAGESILLDSSVLISYLGVATPQQEIAAAILENVRAGRNPAVVSAVSAMELLVRPIRLGAAAEVQRITDLLSRFPNLALRPVDLDVARAAASVRARTTLTSPDALIIGTGIASRIRHVVTNDEAWARRLQPMQLGPEIQFLGRFMRTASREEG